MGRIVDVVVDRTGQVRAAVIDLGGFLGVGSRKIAVDWNALSFPPPGEKAGALPSIDAQPGEGRARIPRRQAGGRAGCPRQARTVPISISR
jgi:hypothetical protein